MFISTLLYLKHWRSALDKLLFDSESRPVPGWRARTRCLPGVVFLILLFGHSAVAQNALAAVRVPTGDEVRYGKHSPCACRPIKDFNRPLVAIAQVGCLTRRERRIDRQKYQDQHRDEFPAIYRPGVE